MNLAGMNKSTRENNKSHPFIQTVFIFLDSLILSNNQDYKQVSQGLTALQAQHRCISTARYNHLGGHGISSKEILDIHFVCFCLLLDITFCLLLFVCFCLFAFVLFVCLFAFCLFDFVCLLCCMVSCNGHGYASIHIHS